MDLRELLQRRVRWAPEGHRLDVGVDENLDEAFGNPCRGVFKVLLMRYRTYTHRGAYTVKVPGPGTPLGQHLRVGWKPGT